MKEVFNRREFLRKGGLAGAGLALFIVLPRHGEAAVEDSSIGPGLSIAPNGTVTIRIYKQEMGQGAATGIAMIAAEELDAEWSRVRIEFVDFDHEALDIGAAFGRFDTGGSMSVKDEWTPMRRAGAIARLMLMQAAAARWGTAVDECETVPGQVVNRRTGERLGFGELAEAAGRLPIPDTVEFKAPKNRRLIGRPLTNLNASAIVGGRLRYALDVKVPGMQHAMIIRPPVVGGSLKRFDDSDARAVAGFVEAFPVGAIERNEIFCKGIRGGVAVLADSTWGCIAARRRLKVEWDDGPNAARSSAGLFGELDAVRARGDGQMRYAAGEVEEGKARAKTVVTAAYESPFLAHGLMEPPNAIAHWKADDAIEIWAGTQSPHYTASSVAAVFGVDKRKITLHPCPMGGGFGRRFFTDFVLEAVAISRRTRKPVKLTWTREDEIQFGFYHPLRKDTYRCGLDEAGNIAALEIQAVTTHEWGGLGLPFIYGHRHMRSSSRFHAEKLLPWGSWRSVMAHLDVFSRELFIDELAVVAGKDPLRYRLEQLARPLPEASSITAGATNGETMARLRRLHARLYEEVRRLSDWDRPREPGVGLGVAAGAYHNSSVCAQVAEVEVTGNAVRVRRIWCVADCGLVINPRLVEGQIEGSILWGLTPVLHGGIDAVAGRVVQSNFYDMRLLRMDEIPGMEIKLLNLEDREPQGVGEFAVLPIAPAVLNAVFAATGRRIRSLNIPPEAFV